MDRCDVLHVAALIGASLPLGRLAMLLFTLLLPPLSAPPASAADATAKPAVLLVGDAVTRQYAGKVRELLGERTVVDFLTASLDQPSKLAEFKVALGAKSPHYALIYFALEPAMAREWDSDGRPAESGGGQPRLDPRQFRRILDDLFRDVNRSGQKLVWATAVPVPTDMISLPAARLESFNQLAANLAHSRRALLLDLHDYVRIRRADLQRPGDFMLTDTGINVVASVVANKIEEVLLEGNEPGLPHILVLGDSISGQYSTFLREKLLHRANVRVGGTAYETQPDWASVVRREITEREAEIGRPFDLIQFNWGLHALKWAQGTDYSMRFKEGYSRCVPLERYGAELEKLIVELKRTGRRLVWATTTPANNGSQPDDAVAYNAVARQIVQRHGLAVNDLHAFVVQHRLAQNEPQNCHFPRSSAEQLGHHVAATLLEFAKQGASNAAR
jgi:acyl-CoA thioesterase-1